MSVTQPQVLNASAPIHLEDQRSGMIVQSSSKMERNKIIIFKLGIVQVLIGLLCMVLGLVTTGYSVYARSNFYSTSRGSYHGYNYYYVDVNLGQAMWCGIWILIAGCLGIKAGGKKSTRCLVNAHMGFAIVGAVASGFLFLIDMNRALVVSVNNQQTLLLGLVIPVVIASFVALVILIVSASYSCCINCGDCCDGCCGNSYNEPYTHQNGTQQVVYLANPMQQQQQPVAFPAGSAQYFVLQQAPGTNMSEQAYFPMQQIPNNQMIPQLVSQPQVQQPLISGLSATAPPQAQAYQPTPSTNQLDGDQVQSKQETINAFPSQPDNASDLPPAYSQEFNQL